MFAEFQPDDDLAEENSEHDELIDQLLKQLTKYEKTIDGLKSQISSKKDKIKKLETIQREHKNILLAKENELKTLNKKLKELTNTVCALKTKSNIPSAKLNSKNIELTKQYDDLLKQMDDLKMKLTAKSNELDRCQKAAGQKNKIIKELKETKYKLKCNLPEHKDYAETIKSCKSPFVAALTQFDNII